MKTFKRIFIFVIVLTLIMTFVGCKKDKDNDQGGGGEGGGQGGNANIVEGWANTGIGESVAQPPEVKKSAKYSVGGQELVVGCSENVTAVAYDNYITTLKNSGYVTTDESTVEDETIGLYYFEGVKDGKYVYTVYLTGMALQLSKNAFIESAQQFGGTDFVISADTNMFTYVSNFDFTGDEDGGGEQGGGEQGGGEITAILQGYNLSTNCKIEWDMSGVAILVKIGDDFYYSIANGLIEVLYKKTSTGYLAYEKEYNDSFQKVWSEGVPVTVSDANSDIELVFVEYCLGKEPTDKTEFVGKETIMVDGENIQTNKYSNIINYGDMYIETSTWYHPNYSIIVKYYSIASELSATFTLTSFDENISSFAEAGIVLP